MATALNVIPRNKVTWESPKKERKTQWRLPPTALVLAISTAQKIFAISSNTDKKLLPQFRKIVCLVKACKARKRINEDLFRAYLLTECAYSGCEPQGGENMSAELDGCTVRLRRVVA